MALIDMDFNNGSGGVTLLWENPSTTTLASGTIQIPNLDNYNTIIFELGDSTGVYYSGIRLSDLATAKYIGYITPQSTMYEYFREVTHSAQNTLTISTGKYSYFRATGIGSGDNYAVFLKIYGVNI